MPQVENFKLAKIQISMQKRGGVCKAHNFTKNRSWQERNGTKTGFVRLTTTNFILTAMKPKRNNLLQGSSIIYSREMLRECWMWPAAVDAMPVFLQQKDSM